MSMPRLVASTAASTATAAVVAPTKRQRRENPITPLDHESLDCVATPHGPLSTSTRISNLDKEIILARLQKEIVQAFALQLTVPRLCRNRSRPTTNQFKNKEPRIQESTTTTTTTNLESILKPNHRKQIDKTIPNSKLKSNKVKRRQERYSTNSSTKNCPAIQVLKTRLLIGINECTRALEESIRGHQQQQPGGSSLFPVSLIIACRDVNPPTIQAHVPQYIATLELQQQRQQQHQQQHDNDPTSPSLSPPILLLLPGRSCRELGQALGIRQCCMVGFRHNPTIAQQPPQQEAMLVTNESCHNMLSHHAKVDSFVKFCIEKLQNG